MSPPALSRRAAGATLLGLASFAREANAQPRPAPPLEIVVRTVNNLRSASDVATLVDLAASHGVKTINLAAKQDEDDEVTSGQVFYDSKLAPRAGGYERFDALRETVEAAHRNGIRVRAWMPQFHDQVAVRGHPAWQMQALVDGRVRPFVGKRRIEYFVNPLHVEAQAYQRALIEEVVRDYAVDGVVLDWLRFDDYNMDLGPATRARFAADAGYDPLSIDLSTANPRREQWNAWRAAHLALYGSAVRATVDAVRPGLPLGLYTLPPQFDEVGQRAELFQSSLTFLSPMAYFRDWGFHPHWVDRQLLPETMLRAGSREVIPVADEDWSDAAAREILPELRSRMPAIRSLCWFIYGQWTPAAFERIARLSRLLS